jgi:hypothetical protein
MSLIRTARVGAGAFALAAAAALTVTAGEASAAVDWPQCTSWHNGATITATCSNPTDSGWYLRLKCERWRNSAIYYVNGTLVWGSGTSQANCGAGDPDNLYLVNL